MDHADDPHSTDTCDRCEMSIPTDADRCPVCDYRPAGRNPLAMRVGEYLFGTAIVASVLVFVGGVTGLTPVIPEIMSRVAIVTPYTTGISAFFFYYLYRKRRTTPTDSEVFD